MSADNGYILRLNEEGKYVLQMYFASNETYPPINRKNALVFDSIQDALMKYEELSQTEIIEYGLSVLVGRVTLNPKRSKNSPSR